MRTLIVGTALFVLAACSPLRTETPIPPVTAPTIAAATSSEAATQPSSAAPATQPAQATNTALPAATSPGPVGLQINTPADGAIVNAPQVTVAGSASPGAVVTVNDDIIVVGPDGQFLDNVALSEGPNVIEVIASNTSGSEESVELTVTYEP